MIILIQQIISQSEVHLKTSEYINEYLSHGLTTAVFFTSDNCRTCDDYIFELNEAYNSLSDFISIFQVDCVVEKEFCSHVTHQPSLLVFNHNRYQNPGPAEYFGVFESSKIIQYLNLMLNFNFTLVTDINVLVQIMQKNLKKQQIFVFFEGEKPKLALNLQIRFLEVEVVLVNLGKSDVEKFELMFGVQIDDLSLFSVFNGKMARFPFGDEETELIWQWIQEIERQKEEL